MTRQSDIRPARRRLLCGLIAVAFLGAAPLAHAQGLRERLQDLRDRGAERRWRRRRALDRFNEKGPEFRDRVLDARRTGELRPLRELNARLRRRGFELLDADVYETEEGWVYDVRVLGPAGRVRDVLVDGRTLRPLSYR